MEFNYVFQSIKKNVGFKLDKETYTQEEVCKLLRNVCSAVDITLMQVRDAKVAEE